MNVLKREIKGSIKILIIWAVVIIIFVASGLYKYTGFDASGMDITVLMDSMPKMVLAVFGFTSFDLNKATGFYGIIFQYIMLMGGFFAAHMGFNTLVKEERDNTTEFLMVRPISRRRIVVEKWTANLFAILVFVAVSFVTSIIGLKLVVPEENLMKVIINLHLALFLVEFFLMNMGLLIASVMKKINKVSSIVMSLVFAFYILGILIDFNDVFQVLRILCPFRYFSVSEIIDGGRLGLIYSVVTIFGGLGCTLVSLPIYEKRDLNV